MPTFDLATQPWVALRPLDGARSERAGLKEVFLNAHRYADAELSFPPASAGMWRILALIGARLTGLDRCEEREEWGDGLADVLEEGAFDPDEVARYFDDEYPDRFDLFGPRPWMQDPRLGELGGQCAKTSGINKLCWGRPAGNTQVWLRHTTDLAPRPLPAADAAHHLIATLYYGASGRCTSRTAGGVTAADTAAGPLRRSLSIHPLGRTLFETIVLNIPFSPGEEAEPAMWERERLRDPTLPPDPGVGTSGLLVNRTRHAVLLHPADDGSDVVDATVTWGTRSTAAAGGARVAVRDPYQIYYTTKEGGQAPQPADGDRAVWRDVDAILRDGEHRGRTTIKPSLITDLAFALPRGLAARVRIRAFGFDQDGQARDNQWFTATTPPVLHWLHEGAAHNGDLPGAGRALARIQNTTDAAEAAGENLVRALDRTWKDSGLGGDSKKAGPAPWTRLGASRFWSRAEETFWTIVHDESAEGPGNAFIRLAKLAYDEVTENYRHRPRTARAVARHRGSLSRGWIPENGDGIEGTEREHTVVHAR